MILTPGAKCASLVNEEVYAIMVDCGFLHGIAPNSSTVCLWL